MLERDVLRSGGNRETGLREEDERGASIRGNGSRPVTACRWMHDFSISQPGKHSRQAGNVGTADSLLSGIVGRLSDEQRSPGPADLCLGHGPDNSPPGVSSLAWSTDDQHLVLDFVARQDSSEAEVLADPFGNAVYHPGRPLPCPDGVRFCAEFTPQYDQAGHIVFLACLQPSASTCRFVLAETSGSRSVALASSVGLARNQGGGWSTIDGAGNAAIFTAPRGDGWATYRWTSGHVVRLSRPVEQPDW